MQTLKISPQNNKTKHLQNVKSVAKYLTHKRKIYSLDLPAGLACPGAKDCKAYAYQTAKGWKVKDGPSTIFRCFSASTEAVFPATRKARAYNYALLQNAKSFTKIYRLLEASLPANTGILRLHVSGDFFSLNYLDAVVWLATRNTDKLFYTYTKSLHYLSKIDCSDLSQGVIQPNFLVTASIGGKFDHLIPTLNVRTAKVIFNEKDAKGLPIDHDDSHAATKGGNFALLVHGIQPKGSMAATALKALKGKGSYGQ